MDFGAPTEFIPPELNPGDSAVRMTPMHTSEKPPRSTDASDISPTEAPAGGVRTGLTEQFLTGVIFAIAFYDKELIGVESCSTGFVRRGLQKARESISRNLKERLRCVTSVALLSQMISSDQVSNDLVNSFNAVFPQVLRAVKSIALKDSLVSEVTKLCEPKAFRVCPYCGRLRVPVAANEPHFCPPPASCRKGWHNRQDWLRRKSQRSSNVAKPS